MEDRYAIHLARTEIREGYNTGDVERLASAYSESLGDMSCGMPSFFGSEAKSVMRGRLQALFAGYQVHSAPATVEVLLFGDAAVDYGVQELTFTPRSGEPAFVQRRRYLEVWRKEADSCWRIVLYMENSDEQPIFADQMLAALLGRQIDPATGKPSAAAEVNTEPSKQPVAEA